MSMLDTPTRYQQQINFAAPAALSTDVVGTDADVGVNQFFPKQALMLLDVKHTTDPAAGLTYTLFIRRLQLSRTRIGITQDFLVGFNGRIRPNMPKGINPNFFQWVEQQNSGALTGQNYLMTYDRPIVM